MRIAHLRNYQLGEHAELCAQLLRELGEAGDTLADSEKRAAYDAERLASAGSALAPETGVVPKPHMPPPSTSPPYSAPPAEPIQSPPTATPPGDQSTRPDWLVPLDSPRDEPVPSTSSIAAPPPAKPTRRERRADPLADSPVPRPEPATPSDRPESRFLQELSDKALSDLREPVKPEEESLWQLGQQLLNEWTDALPSWWPNALRRPLTLAITLLVLLGALIFGFKSL